jgi:hypothetical protein
MKALKLDNASICICGVLLRHHPRLVPPNSSIATMSEVPQDPRSQWPKMVRHRNVTSRPARLGPSPTSTTRTALISLPPCPTRITPEALKNLHRTFSCILCTAMRFTQWAVALSSLAGACEAFRFTVWLGDKCTITGTGTKPSDQELLVIPQVAGDEGCMVRTSAEPR